MKPLTAFLAAFSSNSNLHTTHTTNNISSFIAIGVRPLRGLLKWLLISVLVGTLAGSASALFLKALDEITHIRETHGWLLFFLPFAGAGLAFIYSRYGKDVEAGNNLLIDQIHDPKAVIPLRMAPLILFSTLMTHLFGGSAGREGTAVQMGGSLADQITGLLKLHNEDRKLLLMAGISAGFASVFGTPLAGAIFGLEVLSIGRLKYAALFPCFASAIIANKVCLAWGITHGHYAITELPPVQTMTLLWAALAGIFFGLCALVFAWSSHKAAAQFKRSFNSPLLRAFAGGTLIIILSLSLQSTRYLGLGLPAISESFVQTVPFYDFILKMLFTIITLSSGFKGGEVTPLFFIGATLGNALTWILPLPTSLLAGMGFVAVFAGAANTPLACIFMALELFGSTSGIYIAIACVMSYLFSGHNGIYHAQKLEVHKYAQKN